MTKWRPVLKSSWLSEFECLDDGQDSKRQNCKLECEGGGERHRREKGRHGWNWTSGGTFWHRTGHRWIEKSNMNVLTAIRETYAQLGRSCCQNGSQRNLCRTGHRWIEKSNMNVLTAIRERMLSWAGHVARMDHKEICAKALRCRGLQWRCRQLHWEEVEKDKWSGPHPQRYRWEDMVAGEVSKFTGNADGPSESVQENTGWLHFAQNRGRWKQFSKCGRSPDGPGCLGDPCASRLTGTNACALCWQGEETRYGTELFMAGWIRMAVGMDVDVAAVVFLITFVSA